MEPRLYILMRSDMDSLNSGKAMAQSAHAANAFVKSFEGTVRAEIEEGYEEWREQTHQGFGTTIVLDCFNWEEMNAAVSKARVLGYATEIIVDPTYPVRDGGVTHLVPVYTCAYIFNHGVEDVDIQNVLEAFPLYA